MSSDQKTRSKIRLHRLANIYVCFVAWLCWLQWPWKSMVMSMLIYGLLRSLYSWASPLGSLPVLGVHSFSNIWKVISLNIWHFSCSLAANQKSTDMVARSGACLFEMSLWKNITYGTLRFKLRAFQSTHSDQRLVTN